MPLNLKVGEKYKLTSDKYNVVINELYEKQVEGQPSGEFDYKLAAKLFHPNIEKALIEILQKEIQESDAENLAELVHVIHKAKRDIVSAAAEMTKALNGKVLES